MFYIFSETKIAFFSETPPLSPQKSAKMENETRYSHTFPTPFRFAPPCSPSPTLDTPFRWHSCVSLCLARRREVRQNDIFQTNSLTFFNYQMDISPRSLHSLAKNIQDFGEKHIGFLEKGSEDAEKN